MAEKKKNQKDYFVVEAATRDELLGLSSSDTSDYFSRPDNYQDKCAIAWNDYLADPAMGYLIDRLSHFAINGTRWQLENKDEKPFWDEWARIVNDGIVDVLPGLDEVEKWICKNLAITGMAVIEWEWGKREINGQIYEVPVSITLHPSYLTTLTNESGKFGKTTVVVKYDDREVKIKRDGDKTQGFILKYNNTPADMTVSGKSALTPTSISNNIETTLYPEPPFLKVHEDIDTRLKLREVDRDTVWDLQNLLWLVNIGDETHPPVPAIKDENGKVVEKGTIEKVKERMSNSSNERAGSTRVLYLPYYVKMENKSPDTSVLLNYDKYLASTLNLLSAFGILVVPGRDTRLNLTEINTQNFEQMIEFLRVRHIQRFIEGVLCREIVKRNKKKLTEVPSLRFNQVNTKTEEFRRGILTLLSMGKISSRMGLEFFGVNKDYVISDLKDELNEDKFTGKWEGYSEQELFNLAVPIRFKQQVSGSEEQPELGEETQDKTADTLGTNTGGRETKQQQSIKGGE